MSYLENVKYLYNEHVAYTMYIDKQIDLDSPTLLFNEFIDSKIGWRYINILREKKLNRILNG